MRREKGCDRKHLLLYESSSGGEDDSVRYFPRSSLVGTTSDSFGQSASRLYEPPTTFHNNFLPTTGQEDCNDTSVVAPAPLVRQEDSRTTTGTSPTSKAKQRRKETTSPATSTSNIDCVGISMDETEKLVRNSPPDSNSSDKSGRNATNIANTTATVKSPRTPKKKKSTLDASKSPIQYCSNGENRSPRRYVRNDRKDHRIRNSPKPIAQETAPDDKLRSPKPIKRTGSENKQKKDSSANETRNDLAPSREGRISRSTKPRSPRKCSLEVQEPEVRVNRQNIDRYGESVPGIEKSHVKRVSVSPKKIKADRRLDDGCRASLTSLERRSRLETEFTVRENLQSPSLCSPNKIRRRDMCHDKENSATSTKSCSQQSSDKSEMDISMDQLKVIPQAPNLDSSGDCQIRREESTDLSQKKQTAKVVKTKPCDDKRNVVRKVSAECEALRQEKSKPIEKKQTRTTPGLQSSLSKIRNTSATSPMNAYVHRLYGNDTGSPCSTNSKSIEEMKDVDWASLVLRNPESQTTSSPVNKIKKVSFVVDATKTLDTEILVLTSNALFVHAEASTLLSSPHHSHLPLSVDDLDGENSVFEPCPMVFIEMNEETESSSVSPRSSPPLISEKAERRTKSSLIRKQKKRDEIDPFRPDDRQGATSVMDDHRNPLFSDNPTDTTNIAMLEREEIMKQPKKEYDQPNAVDRNSNFDVETNQSTSEMSGQVKCSADKPSKDPEAATPVDSLGIDHAKKERAPHTRRRGFSSQQVRNSSNAHAHDEKDECLSSDIPKGDLINIASAPTSPLICVERKSVTSNYIQALSSPRRRYAGAALSKPYSSYAYESQHEMPYNGPPNIGCWSPPRERPTRGSGDVETAAPTFEELQRRAMRIGKASDRVDRDDRCRTFSPNGRLQGSASRAATERIESRKGSPPQTAVSSENNVNRTPKRNKEPPSREAYTPRFLELRRIAMSHSNNKNSPKPEKTTRVQKFLPEMDAKAQNCQLKTSDVEAVHSPGKRLSVLKRFSIFGMKEADRIFEDQHGIHTRETHSKSTRDGSPDHQGEKSSETCHDDALSRLQKTLLSTQRMTNQQNTSQEEGHDSPLRFETSECETSRDICRNSLSYQDQRMNTMCRTPISVSKGRESFGSIRDRIEMMHSKSPTASNWNSPSKGNREVRNTARIIARPLFNAENSGRKKELFDKTSEEDPEDNTSDNNNIVERKAISSNPRDFVRKASEGEVSSCVSDMSNGDAEYFYG